MRKAMAAAVVIACVTACTGAGTHRAAGSKTPSPSPRGASSSTALERSRSVLVGSLRLSAPEGWRVDAGADFGHACLEPATSSPRLFDCGGLDVYYGWDGRLPGNEMTNFITDGPGWYHATDVEPCPVEPKDGPGGLNGIRSGALLHHGTAPVGSHRADYYKWAANCDNGFRFTPRAWYLPVSRVVVFDYVGTPDAPRILRGAHFVGRWIVAYLHATHQDAGGLSVDVDEISWLSGEAANNYAAKHGMEHPVPNDYLIVDPDTSTSPMALSRHAVVLSDFSLGSGEPGHVKQVTVDRLIAFLSDRKNWQTPFHVHIGPSDVIDEVQEQYRP